jgi:hypothetical protein
MSYLDAAILNVVEAGCRKFQVLTGRTNVWLAGQLTNLSIIMYFVWAAMSFWGTDLSLRIWVGLSCGALLYALSQTIFKVSIEEYENNAYRRVAKGLRNPRRVRDAQLRISFLTLAIVLVLLYRMLIVYVNLLPPNVRQVSLRLINTRAQVVFLSYLLIVLTTVLLYLLACDPLPPCAGRVRDWVQRLLPARRAAAES